MREGIEITEPVAGGVRSPVTANGRRSFDVGAPDHRRRRANPLLAPAPRETAEPKAPPRQPRDQDRRRRQAAGSRSGEEPASDRRADPTLEEDTGAEQQPPGHGVVCTVGMCPICAVVTAMGDVRPELTEHLLLAGRELLMALKSLIDARVQNGDDPPAGSGGLERITIE